MPFANENAGTIRMRSNSHTISDVSTYNWHQQQQQQQPQEEIVKSSHQPKLQR